MSDFQTAPDWWQASDGKWYPPAQNPTAAPPAAPTPAAPGWQQSVLPPPPGGGPMGYTPYGAGQPLDSVQGLATTSLVTGIIGILFCPVILSVIAIATGWIALSRIKDGTAAPDPKGLALAGVICGVIGIVVGIGVFAFLTAVRA